MSQWSFRYVPETCRDFVSVGVRDRGHADDLEAEGAGVHGHLHGQRVAAGEGDDHEYVAGAGRAGVQDGARQAVDPFQGRAQRRRHDVDADDARYGEQVHQGEAARAVDDVLRGERGVPGAEREEPAAVGDGVGDQRAGRLDRRRRPRPAPAAAGRSRRRRTARPACCRSSAKPLRRPVDARSCSRITLRSGPVLLSIRLGRRRHWVRGPRRSRRGRSSAPAVRRRHLTPRGFNGEARLSVVCVRIESRASAQAGEPPSLRQS